MRRSRAAPATDHAEFADGTGRVRAALSEQQARLRSTSARLHAARAVDIHDARVAARRLRSLLATYRPLLDERRTRRLRRRLRAFARALSEVREADVRRDMLLALTMLEPALASADIRSLRATLRQSCSKSRRSLRRKVSSQAWASSVRKLGAEGTRLALGARRGAGLADVLKLVDRPWRDAAELLERPPRSAAQLHRLRLALKHCRYALESVSSLKATEAERVLDRLRSVQDSLGEHRDAVQARQWVRTQEARLGQAFARRLDRMLRRHERTLRAQAVERAARVLPAYAAWRRATRGLRTAPAATRGPA